MGSSFKDVIFEEHVKESLVDWAHNIKKRKGKRVTSADENRSNAIELEHISLQHVLQARRDALMEQGGVDSIEVVEENGRWMDSNINIFNIS